MLQPQKPLGDVVVLGLGRSGHAAACYMRDLLQAGAEMDAGACAGEGRAIDSLTIYAGASTPESTAAAVEFVEAGIPVFFDTEDVQGTFDLCVISPGISPLSGFGRSALAAARQVVSEPAFASLLSPQRWVGITGTNGKSTVTALVAHLVRACGRRARVAGNIGEPCTEVVCARALDEGGDDELLSVELSSYMLGFPAGLRLDACCLLNITPDHLAWHGSMDAYVDAKKAIFGCAGPEAPLVIDATMECTREIYKQLRDAGRVAIPIGSADGITSDMTQKCGAANAAFVDTRCGDMLTVRMGEATWQLVGADELQIKGAHNQENALAAAAMLLALGYDPQGIREGLRTFEALEHRIEPCGVRDGVSFYNDSKATNPEAVLPALVSFPGQPIVLLLGGKDKLTDLGELVASCQATCRAVVCYGASKERFLEAFGGVCPEGESAGGQALSGSGRCAVLEAEHMADALALAVDHAVAGDVVLLSPACASFDEFRSFEERGGVFKELVAGYIQK